ncbi:cytochrome c maturation protein CcmE (plasmid) [Halobacterium noricense]|uniref:cytochrome c maturation protein CcmE domain-containing protein n=1 Tax=Halobacterium noricense TaxID=223182 RepID=UPI001E482B83|nr:cytochrome c maturation protein CcmE [Halobacterium noricense]UHH27135.1 cytochrome c maturation protein CcmE [Halobacterium noricense]
MECKAGTVIRIPKHHPAVRRKNKLLVAGVGILVLLGVLGVTTMSASTEFVTPTALSEDNNYEGDWVNLEGTVQNLDTSGERTTFAVADGNHSIPVTYEGTLPDTMQEGRIVVAKGRYADGSLTAQQLSVRAHEGEERPDDV